MGAKLDGGASGRSGLCWGGAVAASEVCPELGAGHSGPAGGELVTYFTEFWGCVKLGEERSCGVEDFV